MFVWSVTLLQVLALLICPLTCVSGQACCASELSSVGSCSIQVAKYPPSSVEECCCCEKQQAQESQEQDEQPSSPVKKSTCQGVCGGAILEKSAELSSVAGFWMLPPEVSAGEVFTLSSSSQRESFDHISGSGNYGRSLRTLHASFLC